MCPPIEFRVPNTLRRGPFKVKEELPQTVRGHRNQNKRLKREAEDLQGKLKEGNRPRNRGPLSSAEMGPRYR